MQHPFDGIVTPNNPGRRTWLAAGLALFGGLFATRLFAAAPPAAATEENAEPEPRRRSQPSSTARNEEGGAVTQALNEVATTRGLREEGAMTRALNENGGPRVTTLALNEEGARKN
jgi:hypothetical protein